MTFWFISSSIRSVTFDGSVNLGKQMIDFGKACLITTPTAQKYSSFYNHIASKVLQRRPVSTSSDIFSFGMTINSV